MLAWARERGFDLEPLVMTVGPKLATGSDQRLVRWAVQNGVGLLGDQVVEAAILIDRLDLLRRAVGRGYRTPAGALDMAIRLDRVHIARWLNDSGQCRIMNIGKLSPLLERHGIPMLSWLCMRGDLDVSEQCYMAAANGWLTGVRWLCAKADALWRKSLAQCVVTAVNVHVFGWAMAHGFAMDARAFCVVAWRSSAGVLCWLKGRNVPWDQRTAMALVHTNRFAEFKWAIESGCPWDYNLCLAQAAHRGQADMAEWIQSRGPSVPTEGTPLA